MSDQLRAVHQRERTVLDAQAAIGRDGSALVAGKAVIERIRHAVQDLLTKADSVSSAKVPKQAQKNLMSDFADQHFNDRKKHVIGKDQSEAEKIRREYDLRLQKLKRDEQH